MTTRRIVTALVVAVPLGLAVLLLLQLLFAVLVGGSYRVAVGSPLDWLHLGNFYDYETDTEGRTFRWSGIESQVSLHAADDRPYLLELHLHGDLLAQQPDPRLFVRSDDTTLAVWQIQPGWRTYEVLVPPGAAQNTWTLPQPISLAVSPYCPVDSENRVLGVPMDWYYYRPLAAVPTAEFFVARVALIIVLVGIAIGLAMIMSQLFAAARAVRWATLRQWHLVPIVGLPLLLLPAVPLPVDVRQTVAWAVALLPGWLLGQRLVAPDRNPLARALVAACMAIALPVLLLLLALLLLPFNPPPLLLAGLFTALSVLAVLLRVPAPVTRGRLVPRNVWLVAGLTGLAAVFRMLWLGSAEFQGDEARAIVMATHLLDGDDSVLMMHRKGPVEVLLPAVPLILTAQISEWGARLPFALAGVAAVPGLYVLLRRMLGGRVAQVGAGVAAGLLAVDGLLIGFSRIVQYPIIIILMSVCSVMLAWQFYRGTRYSQVALVLAATFAAVAMLSHYDGIYLVPVLAGLVLAGGWRHWRRDVRAWARGLAAPALVGVVLVAGFYIPFFTHENFSRTLYYLNTRVASEYAPLLLFYHAPHHFERISFYGTRILALIPVVLLTMGVLRWLAAYAPTRWAAWLTGGLWLLGVLLPGLFILPDGNHLAVVALAPALLLLLLAPRTPAALRVLLLWFGVPFVVYAFFIADPRNHFYNVNTAMWLLCGVVVGQVWHAPQRFAPMLRAPAWVRPAVVGMAGLALAVVLPYLYIAFLQQKPEYERSFPQFRPPIYAWLTGERVPGIFGFPHRDGWKVVGNLYEQGVLDGAYLTNQRERIGIWYTRGEATCGPEPDYYLLASWDGDRIEAMPPAFAPDDPDAYTQQSCVVVDGMRLLRLYGREPIADLPPFLALTSDEIAAYDARRLQATPVRSALKAPFPQHAHAAAWGNGLSLVGYDLPRPTLAPGQRGDLTLYWDAEEPPRYDYEPRVAVYDQQGNRVGTATPYCQPPAAREWLTTDTNTLHYRLQGDAPLAPGTYTLRLTLHDPTTDQPLPLPDGGDSVTLTTITVAPAAAVTASE